MNIKSMLLGALAAVSLASVSNVAGATNQGFAQYVVSVQLAQQDYYCHNNVEENPYFYTCMVSFALSQRYTAQVLFYDMYVDYVSEGYAETCYLYPNGGCSGFYNDMEVTGYIAYYYGLWLGF